MRNSLLAFFAFILASCGDSKLPYYYVENFRKTGMTDDEVIQAAINSAPEGATIEFSPSTTYEIGNRIFVKRFQCLNGNNATLRRANETFALLDKPASDSAQELYLQNIPSGWTEGDQIQIFTDSTTGSSNGFGDYRLLPNIVTKIEGNKIILSTKVGKSLNERITEWPAGAKVRKVFTMLRGDSIQFRSAPFTVMNMNFDGNRDHNVLNYYWNVNSTIFMRGMGGRVENCSFFDIPNETIVGQGMIVTKCRAKNLNGSFVHLSGSDSMKDNSHRNAMVIANTVNGVCQVSTYVTGHSEGVVTTSYNGGFATVSNNRFYNSGESAIGTIDGHLAVDDGGKSDFIITDNLFKNCKRIIHSVVYGSAGSRLPTDIFISNNVFSNCGKNDWSKMPYENGHSGITMGPNSYSNGTSWYMPESELKSGTPEHQK